MPHIRLWLQPDNVTGVSFFDRPPFNGFPTSRILHEKFVTSQLHGRWHAHYAMPFVRGWVSHTYFGNSDLILHGASSAPSKSRYSGLTQFVVLSLAVRGCSRTVTASMVILSSDIQPHLEAWVFICFSIAVYTAISLRFWRETVMDWQPICLSFVYMWTSLFAALISMSSLASPALVGKGKRRNGEMVLTPGLLYPKGNLQRIKCSLHNPSTHRTENILGCGGRGVMPARPGGGPAMHVGKRGKLSLRQLQILVLLIQLHISAMRLT